MWLKSTVEVSLEASKRGVAASMGAKKQQRMLKSRRQRLWETSTWQSKFSTHESMNRYKHIWASKQVDSFWGALASSVRSRWRCPKAYLSSQNSVALGQKSDLRLCLLGLTHAKDNTGGVVQICPPLSKFTTSWLSSCRSPKICA